jgi:aqualysin 1
MKVRMVWLFTLVVILLTTNAAPAGAQRSPAPLLAAAGEALPGQYIVVFQPEVSAQAGVEPLMAQVHALGVTEQYVFTDALQGFSAQLSADALAALRGNPAVAYVEQDEVIKISARQRSVTWGLDRISQRKLPLNHVFTYLSSGKGVTAYVIDTGIWTAHGDFGGRARVGVDVMNDGQNGIDCNGHGTHVAGTIGGSLYGVAKQVKLVGVRVLDCWGSGTVSSVVAGIDWVTRSHNSNDPAVANMSLGGMGSAALDSAVEKSIQDGITYVVAAGNDSGDACENSPARVKDAITVGATDNHDNRAPFSNYGSCLDLFAPGVSIESDWNMANANQVLSGTSMASPHAAGVAVLYLSKHPHASPSEVRARLTGNATKNVVKDSGDGSPDLLLFEYD